MRRGRFVLFAVAASLAGCGESDVVSGEQDRAASTIDAEELPPESATSTATPEPERDAGTESASLSGEAKASAFEDLPVPVEATVNPASEGQDWTYFLPPNVTLEELDGWYDRQLPDGADWQSWKWCRTEVISQSIDRVWHKPGTTSVMGVIIGKNDPADGGEAFIYLSGDESGPAACDE